MKQSPFRSRSSKLSSFTLVELLVVIAIIAILASVIAVSAGSAIKSAQRAKAQTLAGQIQAAAMNYYTEYSVYPLPTSAAANQDFYAGAADTTYWPSIIYSLCGNINPYDGSTTAPSAAAANTRAIAFLSLRKSDVEANATGRNSPLNPATPSTATMPYLNIAIDGDYSGILGDSGSALGKLPDFSGASFTWVGVTTGTPVAKPTVGVAVWANCNPSTTGTNANFWVRTY